MGAGSKSEAGTMGLGLRVWDLRFSGLALRYVQALGLVELGILGTLVSEFLSPLIVSCNLPVGTSQAPAASLARRTWGRMPSAPWVSFFQGAA